MVSKIAISPPRGQQAQCRKEGRKGNCGKIPRGQLRLAEEIRYVGKLYTGWGWRHWRCVSAEQIASIQAATKNGGCEYNWSALEAYNQIGRYQAKVRRVITQGYIDPEDTIEELEWKVLGDYVGIANTSKSKLKTANNKIDKEIPKLKTKPSQPGTPYGKR